MSSHFLRYYIIKDSLRFINSNITYMQDTSNQAIFKYALFYDADTFYKIFQPFKKNSYQITQQIQDHFWDFLKECINSAYFHANLGEQLFCYYILLSHVTNEFIKDYSSAFTNNKKDKNYIEGMLETYLFNKNEKLKLHKTNIADYFFDSFELNQEDIALLEKPIKRLFGFFCTKNYFLECYQSARFYFNHLANSTTRIKRPLFFFYDLFLNHRKNKRKARTFLYPKRLDTTVLNLTKQEYALKDEIANYSFDELYKEILKECRRACDTLNSYFTGSQNLKPLEKYIENQRKDKE
ncbi:MAG: hypothetical protein K2K50_01685 [Anaeroplasmataceae bacterium]|nr:hypothetical protein [Anaeroplasmataceae bacterium]